MPVLPNDGEDFEAYRERRRIAELNGAKRHVDAGPQDIDFEAMTDLSQLQFPPLKWMVPPFIPEGCTIIGSKPKVGKSSLVVAMSHALSSGGQFFGLSCHRRGVMYLALEDSRRSLNERGRRVSDTWDRSCILAYQAPTLDKGLIDQLKRALDRYPDTGIIFIDVLARVRGARRNAEQPYDHDYRTAATFTDFSHQNGIAVVLLHHVRKAETNGDVFDALLGSTGLIGAVDTGIVITPIEGSVLRFYARGREFGEIDKTIDAHLDTNTWEMVGDYEPDPQASSTRERILVTLKASPKGYPMKPKEVANNTNLPEVTVRQTLKRLAQAGIIRRIGYGAYTC